MSAGDETVWLLWTSEQKVNKLLKIGARRLLNDLLIKGILIKGILSASFRILLDLNNGLKWESLDWKFNLLKWSKFVSSAKWWTLQNFKGWFKSLI